MEDRQVVLQAVKRDGLLLEYAAEELRRDREVVLQAVKQDCLALKYAAKELRGDRQFVLQAVAEDGFALEYAATELRGDREVVLQAVEQSGYLLQCAATELRGDREVVLQAVKRNGRALQCAAEELRGDREVVLQAVAQDTYALEYAAEELRGDREVVQQALRQEWRSTGGDPCMELLDDRQFLVEALMRNFSFFRFTPEQLRRDRGFFLEVAGKYAEFSDGMASAVLAGVPADLNTLLSSDHDALRELHLDFGSEYVLHIRLLNGESRCIAVKPGTLPNDVIAEAVPDAANDSLHASWLVIGTCKVPTDSPVEDWPGVQQHCQLNRVTLVRCPISDDVEQVLENVRCFGGSSLEYSSARIRDMPEVLLHAVSQDGSALQFASGALQATYNIILPAVSQHGLALQFASERLRDDAEVVLAAVEQNGLALEYASGRLRADRAISDAACAQNASAFAFVIQTFDFPF